MASTRGRQVVLPLTNKSGGAVAAGDVVIIDTSNNEAFTTSTAGAVTGGVGIAQEAIASNAIGRVLVHGYAALVNVNASVTRGNYGKTHTVVKQATDAGASRVAGAFCQFLTGGTTPTARVYSPDLGAAAGNVAADAIWDAAGDLAVGTGADTAAKLTKGAAGGVLAMLNGAVTWNAGTSFPGSPATGDRYFRTDRGFEYYYDGTRWLTVQEFSTSLGVADVLYPVGATTNNSYAPVDQGANGCWATRAVLNTTSTANDGSNFHSVQLKTKTPSGTLTSRGSSFTTAADTTGNAVNHSVTIGAALGSTESQWLVSYTRTGIANIYTSAVVFYRLVG